MFCPFTRQHCHAPLHIQCFTALTQFHICAHYYDGNFQSCEVGLKVQCMEDSFLAKPRNICDTVKKQMDRRHMRMWWFMDGTE